MYSFSILRQDFRGGIVRRLDISTTFAMMIALTSFSHFLAISKLVDLGKAWATYLIPTYLDDGLFIFSLGSCVTMEFLRASVGSEILFSLLQKGYDFFGWAFATSLTVLTLNHFRLLPGLGTITSFAVLFVNGSVFLMAFVAHISENSGRIYVVAIYTAILSLYAIQFSYLRMEIITPWLAYFLGEVLARKKLVNLHLVSKVVLAVGIVIYPLIFTYLGKNRSELSGKNEKLELVLSEGTSTDQTGQGETFFGRLNVLGQMSNIVGLTEKKGFYNGYTLSYLSFVLIPRILWPEKPRLDGGQWFAVEIGRSYYQRDGRAANSINMTVPGEMYLNFGFAGLVVGCALFGIFVGYVWRSVSGCGLVSWTFRYYLLFLGMFSLGSDTMTIPQLIAFTLIYKALVFLNRTARA